MDPHKKVPNNLLFVILLLIILVIFGGLGAGWHYRRRQALRCQSISYYDKTGTTKLYEDSACPRE